MTMREMKEEMKRMEREIETNRRKDLDTIINKLFEHPIAQIDEHYDFFKEIEKDLKEYKTKYNI